MQDTCDGAAVDIGEATSDADLPLEVLGARICALTTRMAQATFRWLRMIAEFDRREGWAGVGIRSCAHWLAWTCSMAAGTAREHVRVARTLAELPLVSAEMAAGRLSYAKVREMTRVAGTVDEAALVELARTATASQLTRTVRGFRRTAGDRERQEWRRTARWHVDDDGSVVLSARLPAEEGAAVLAALQAARDDLVRLSGRDPDASAPCAESGGPAADRRDSRDECPAAGSEQPTTGDESAGADDDRSGAGHEPSATGSGQRPREPIDAADVVLQWARGYLSASPEDRSDEDRTLVVVHINAEHLLPVPAGSEPGGPGPTGAERPDSPGESGDGDRPAPAAARVGRAAMPVDCCAVAGVAGIANDTAARLACDAGVLGIIRDADGAVLAHGRRRRTVSPAQRRLLTIRDGGCGFPSCQRISYLEAHYVRHWLHGGRTDPDNLILLCRFHHMACHEGGVVITCATDSKPGSPRGHVTTREGEPLLGDRLPSGAAGWKHDHWILWHGLDGAEGWKDPEAERIRPLWAGERFSLADAVAALFPTPAGSPAAAA